MVAEGIPYRASLINTLTSTMFCVRDHLICMELWPSDKHRLAYMTSLLVFQYCLPLVLVLLCYLRIFLRLKRRRSQSFILFLASCYHNKFVAGLCGSSCFPFCFAPQFSLLCLFAWGLQRYFRVTRLTMGLMLCHTGTCWSAADGPGEPRGSTWCY